jgi:hypothetical protein
MMKPEWMMFAKKMKDSDRKVNIGLVNLAEEPGLMSRFRLVQQKPNLLWFENGFYYNYTGKSFPRELVQVAEQNAYLMYDRRSYIDDASETVKAFREAKRSVTSMYR